jgi:hypothetical protein
MGLDAIPDAVLDPVPDTAMELAATQRIKCDCAPPRIRRICSRASAIASLSSHQPVFTASGTYQIGKGAGLLELNSNIQKGAVSERNDTLETRAQKIASAFGEEHRTETDCGELFHEFPARSKRKKKKTRTAPAIARTQSPFTIASGFGEQP